MIELLFRTLGGLSLIAIGLFIGAELGADSVRGKVVSYCIENLQLCREEYNVIKQKEKLSTYKTPELK